MKTRLALAALPLAAVLLTACSSDEGDKAGTDPQSAPPAPTGEEVCPELLAEASDTHGGGSEPAAAAPEFGETAALWACTYNSTDIGSTASGGTKFGWQRVAPPADVTGTAYDLVRELGELAPANADRACTADLGPRVMLGHVATDGRVTGVVVDLFGCREVRLTSDPARVAPGESEEDGVPAGVLAGSEAFVAGVAALSAMNE